MSPFHRSYVFPRRHSFTVQPERHNDNSSVDLWKFLQKFQRQRVIFKVCPSVLWSYGSHTSLSTLPWKTRVVNHGFKYAIAPFLTMKCCVPFWINAGRLLRISKWSWTWNYFRFERFLSGAASIKNKARQSVDVSPWGGVYCQTRDAYGEETLAIALDLWCHLVMQLYILWDESKVNVIESNLICILWKQNVIVFVPVRGNHQRTSVKKKQWNGR